MGQLEKIAISGTSRNEGQTSFKLKTNKNIHTQICYRKLSKFQQQRNEKDKISINKWQLD